jgi:hypothetical protein
MKPNKLGWVTSMTVNHSYSDLLTADITIVANDPGSLMKQFNKWMKGDGQMPTYEEEYMCLYCGSPNKIENTHCVKCGAPRSFVIG